MPLHHFYIDKLSGGLVVFIYRPSCYGYYRGLVYVGGVDVEIDSQPSGETQGFASAGPHRSVKPPHDIRGPIARYLLHTGT